MAFAGSRKYDSVSIRDEWGIADAVGFHMYKTHRYATDGSSFSVCQIEGRQIALFMEVELPLHVRSELALRKPDWLQAMVYARLSSDPSAAVASIDAHVLGPEDAELETCAFATACVAFSAGLFKVVPQSYSVAFDARASVLVSMEFDDDKESWFGEAVIVDTMERR